MLKKLFIALIGMLAVLNVCAYAADGDIVGEVYTTDILAKVDGEPIPSYNIGGKTAIALRDLENYGFSVYYSDSLRIARISYSKSTGELVKTPIEGIERGTAGEIAGYIYESDITAYINGCEVPSYNIGGTLVAAIEDIAPWNDGSDMSEFGYAKTCLTYTWDEEERTVELLTMPASNRQEVSKLAWEKNMQFTIAGDELTLLEDKYASIRGYALGFSYNPLEDKRAYTLYYTMPDQTREEMGMMYCPGDITVYGEWTDENGVYHPEYMEHEASYLNWTVCIDLEKIKTVLEQIETVTPTFEEAVAYWENGGGGLWHVTSRFDTEDYSVLDMRQTGLPHGGAVYKTVRIDKEPVKMQILMTDIISCPELYGDTLVYFKGSSIYEMDVLTGAETELCAATSENIISYLEQYWNTVYSYESENADVTFVLEKDGEYRIYGVYQNGTYVLYSGNITEAYVLDGDILIYDGDSTYYGNLTAIEIQNVSEYDYVITEYINWMIEHGEKII